MLLSVIPELISLGILMNILALVLSGDASPNSRKGLYRLELILSMLTVSVNALTIFNESYRFLNFQWSYLINFLFFFLGSSTIICLSLYMISAVLDYRRNRNRKRISMFLSIVCYLSYYYLIFTNYHTHWLFYFNSAGEYIRGPLNKLGWFTLIPYSIVALVNYFGVRKRVDKSLKRTVFFIYVCILTFVVMQTMVPDMSMCGILVALVNFVIYVNFQDQSIGCDYTTGVYNRHVFFETLDKLTHQEASFRIVMVSLGDFKEINNHYGQVIGDEYLTRVGGYLKTAVPEATVCRFSPIDFALIVPARCKRDVMDIINQINSRFSSPWTVNGTCSKLNARFTEICYPQHATTANSLIERLEFGLRYAKNESDQVINRFDDKLLAEFERRDRVLFYLNDAVKFSRVELYYQPVYHVDTGRFTSAEALLRLRAQSGALIMPGEFIDIAESSGLVNELGWIVLDKACAFLEANPTLPISCISVNFSASQFKTTCFVEHVLTTLRSYSVNGSQIKIEITERVLGEDMQCIEGCMNTLGRYGVQFYLDDFGTGYSNTASVLSLPFACIKLDKTLIDNIHQSDSARALVGALTTSFHHMHRHVLAEGVEYPQQVSVLQNLGITTIQGFYYARPMDSETFVEFLATHQPENSSEDDMNTPV